MCIIRVPKTRPRAFTSVTTLGQEVLLSLSAIYPTRIEIMYKATSDSQACKERIPTGNENGTIETSLLKRLIVIVHPDCILSH
jgi:hypothetical protein